MNKITLFFLAGIVAISLFFNTFQKHASPPGFDADEAAFGYSAYSILTTGKDEYGTLLPARLKSFGDYKMPVYSYFSVPFIAIFGLNEESTRALNTFVAILFPLAIFFLSKALFKRNDIALLSALFTSISLGLQTVGRQAHEAYLTTFLLTVAVIFFLKTLEGRSLKNSVLFFTLMILSLFSYQSSRIFGAVFFLIVFLFVIQKKLSRKFLAVLLCVFLLFLATDVIYKPERVKTLFFANNIGFSLKINELRAEGGSSLLYNKATVGLQTVTNEYLKYFSPDFLVISGDKNYRFGYPGMSVVTPFIYLLFFVGLFYIFAKKEKYRFLVVALLFVSPIPAALSWADTSLTRSLFMLIPFLIIASYGGVWLYNDIRKNTIYRSIFIAAVVLELLFLILSWNFYFYHYPKRAVVQRAWQLGNRELAEYVQKNYNNIDRFYISRKNGQPYIFLLFYMKYSPTKYQSQASLSSADEYGFGQVEKFDKFDFNFTVPENKKHVALIGYPDDFQNIPLSLIDQQKIKKITVDNQDIFWIYEL